MSYKKFRALAKKRISNGLDLGLDQLSEEISNILNQFNDCRNWSLHIPESLFTSQIELTKKMYEDDPSIIQAPNNPIYDSKFLLYSSEWLTDLLKENKHLYDGFSKAFLQMKKDYSKLIGEDMYFQKRYYDIRELADMDIPKISYQIQQKKYNGIEYTPWLPTEFKK